MISLAYQSLVTIITAFRVKINIHSLASTQKDREWMCRHSN